MTKRRFGGIICLTVEQLFKYCFFRGEKMKNQEFICEEKIIHKDLIKSVNSNMPDINILYELSELFRIFGDSTRIRILYVLFEAEVCVCDIAALLDMTVSAISHQLRILKSAGLVKYRKEGKTCFYSLKDSHVKTILSQGIEHITE